MKTLAIFVLVLGGLLAAAGEQTGQNKSQKPMTKAATSRSTNSPNLVVAAGDSKQRFALWLLSQVKSKKDLSANKSLAFAPEVHPDSASLLKELGWTDWQASVIWSWGDMGPMEPEVQREVQRLDAETNKNMYGFCVWPGGLVGRVGRACIMQDFACDAARNKFDDWAWKMTIATQMHNGDAVNSLRGAGASNVAEFIRNNRGCR